MNRNRIFPVYFVSILTCFALAALIISKSAKASNDPQVEPSLEKQLTLMQESELFFTANLVGHLKNENYQMLLTLTDEVLTENERFGTDKVAIALEFRSKAYLAQGLFEDAVSEAVKILNIPKLPFRTGMNALEHLTLIHFRNRKNDAGRKYFYAWLDISEKYNVSNPDFLVTTYALDKKYHAAFLQIDKVLAKKSHGYEAIAAIHTTFKVLGFEDRAKLLLERLSFCGRDMEPYKKELKKWEERSLDKSDLPSPDEESVWPSKNQPAKRCWTGVGRKISLDEKHKLTSGFVNIEVSISEDGLATEAEISTSHPTGVFEKSAKIIAAEMQYLPAMKNRTWVSSKLELNMKFKPGYQGHILEFGSSSESD